MVERRSRWAPGADVLASAARAVTAVVAHGRSADDALTPFGDAPQRGAIRAVTLGTLRWYLRLAPAVARLTGPRRALHLELRALLIVAAHQVEYSRNAPQATVHAAVDAARILGAPRASGLVNAVMRRFVREQSALLAAIDADRCAAVAHPQWLVERIAEAWPDAVQAILEASNLHPPLTLRVDLSRTTVQAYLDELTAAGITGRPVSWAPAAIELEAPVPVARLPGFAAGRVSVQDAAAQLAAVLLEARAGMRVLDACAAPGGKTLHLLEQTPELADLVAVDVDPERLRRVQENLARAGRSARLLAADVRSATRTQALATPFDRILVDAPCSGTGVIRRHPDIKLLRRPTDIDAFAATQLDILRAAFALLAQNGRLLYCTCSVLPDENERVVAALLRTEPQARAVPLPQVAALVPTARACAVGVQLLPRAEVSGDGFYYACVEKATAGH